MGRPRTPLLDRERIGATALELLDEHGEFSVPQVARRLGVQTGSVYHHVDGRAGVIELVRERVSASIDTATLDLGPWDTALAAWARSYRAAFAAHPHAIPLLMTSPVRAPKVLAQYERAVRLLLDVGFPVERVMTVITALENLVLGSALDLAAPETMWELPTGSPGTENLADALAATGPGRADAAFELALEAFMEHCRTLGPTPSHPPDAHPGPSGA
ncbi:transcriptional regulator, TetR family [Streptomyces sp. LaPpAH-199]|uniref:TetR/AcrR family transcriptional regulator n=1 Tax=Streptomyces TaxID=1883 RepID=UPI000890086D|nr:TetR/AcrR family transcriptional regulator C-terminal domain-containing protein [Streptomyces sp. LaPpAH-199]MYW81894.1 TetR family transcriptional regulator [Streptomyces sp. SID8369]SDC19096.1 transcriptional regulator, TetR family [Streptomyces sp. LaPpAH-199]